MSEPPTSSPSGAHAPPATPLPALPFVGYEDIGDRPHVMVDGAARLGSVLTLSHWPQSPTPRFLARDLSAEIVFEFLRAARRLGASGSEFESSSAPAEVTSAVSGATRAVAVTNDHFDEDGLASVYGLAAPDAALDAADLLVEVASCGDFGVVGSDVAARICFAIGPLASEEADTGWGTSEKYLAMLPRLPELLEAPGRFERHWSAEWESFAAGRSAIESGAVTIEEDPEVDLAIVRRSRSLPPTDAGEGLSAGEGSSAGGGSTPRVSLGAGEGRLPPPTGGLAVHAAAVHSATFANRVLAFDGDLCELYFRYESWVRLVSRQVPLRPDLGPLALELTSREPSGTEWEADGVGAIIARVRPNEGRTEIDPSVIVDIVRNYLAVAPPAWDPFREGGGYIPAPERAGYTSPGSGAGATSASRRRRGWHKRH